MTRQTIPLSGSDLVTYIPAFGFIRFTIDSGRTQIDDVLTDGGGDRYLAGFTFSTFANGITIADSASGDDDAFSQSLSDDWESYESAITITNVTRSLSVTLPGPNHPDNSSTDSGEPYNWLLSSDDQTALVTFVTAGQDADTFTITLDDGNVVAGLAGTTTVVDAVGSTADLTTGIFVGLAGTEAVVGSATTAAGLSIVTDATFLGSTETVTTETVRRVPILPYADVPVSDLADTRVITLGQATFSLGFDAVLVGLPVEVSGRGHDGNFGFDARVFLVGSTETVSTDTTTATLDVGHRLFGTGATVDGDVTDSRLIRREDLRPAAVGVTVSATATTAELLREERLTLRGTTVSVVGETTDATFGTSVLLSGSTVVVTTEIPTARASVRTDGRYTGIPEIVSTTVSTADLMTRLVVAGSTVGSTVDVTDANLSILENLRLRGSTEVVTTSTTNARSAGTEDLQFLGSTENVASVTTDATLIRTENVLLRRSRAIVTADVTDATLIRTEAPEFRGSTETVVATATTASVTTSADVLLLSDFDTTGRVVDLLALVTASNRPTWYADSNRGGTDTGPTDGELGIGENETLISRIQWNPTNTWIQLNDNDDPAAINLGNYINSDDWYLTIQTLADGELTSNSDSGRSANRVRFRFTDQDAIDAFTAIGVGDRFIIAIWRPEVVVRLSGETIGSTTETTTSRFTIVEDLRFRGSTETVATAVTDARLNAGLVVNLRGSTEDVASAVTDGTLIRTQPVLMRGSTATADVDATDAELVTVASPRLRGLEAVSDVDAGDAALVLRIEMRLSALGVTATGVTTAADTVFDLRAFDQSNRIVDTLALITASDDANWYTDSTAGGTDVLDEGEIGISPTDTIIHQIIFVSGNIVEVRDRNVPSNVRLGRWFGDDNAISNWYLTIQTRDHGEITSNQLATTTGNRAQFVFADSDDQDALDAINQGVPFIIAFWQRDPNIVLTAVPETVTTEVSEGVVISNQRFRGVTEVVPGIVTDATLVLVEDLRFQGSTETVATTVTDALTVLTEGRALRGSTVVVTTGVTDGTLIRTEDLRFRGSVETVTTNVTDAGLSLLEDLRFRGSTETVPTAVTNGTFGIRVLLDGSEEGVDAGASVARASVRTDGRYTGIPETVSTTVSTADLSTRLLLTGSDIGSVVNVSVAELTVAQTVLLVGSTETVDGDATNAVAILTEDLRFRGSTETVATDVSDGTLIRSQVIELLGSTETVTIRTHDGRFGTEQRVFLVGSTETSDVGVTDAILVRSQVVELLGSTETVTTTVTDARLIRLEDLVLRGSTETVTIRTHDGRFGSEQRVFLVGSTETVLSTTVPTADLSTRLLLTGVGVESTTAVTNARVRTGQTILLSGSTETVTATTHDGNLGFDLRVFLVGSTATADADPTNAVLIRSQLLDLQGSTETVATAVTDANLVRSLTVPFVGSTETVTTEAARPVSSIFPYGDVPIEDLDDVQIFNLGKARLSLEENFRFLGSTETVAVEGSTANLTRVEPVLQLSDFDATGRDVTMLALVTASGQTVWYQDTDRGGTDTGPTDGELGIGDDETLISRILWDPVNGRIQLNDNDNPTAIDLGAFIASDDWSLTIQTLADGEITSRNDTGRRPNRVRFNFDSAVQHDALNEIEVGTRFIIAIWRPVEIVRLAGTTVASTGIATDADLIRAQPLLLLGSTETASTAVTDATLIRTEDHVLRGSTETVTTSVTDGSLSLLEDLVLRGSTETVAASATDGTFGIRVLLDGSEERVVASVSTARASVRTDGRYTGIPETVSTTVSTADLSTRLLLTGVGVESTTAVTDATLVRSQVVELLGSTETVSTTVTDARVALTENPRFRGSIASATVDVTDARLTRSQVGGLEGSTEIVTTEAARPVSSIFPYGDVPIEDLDDVQIFNLGKARLSLEENLVWVGLPTSSLVDTTDGRLTLLEEPVFRGSTETVTATTHDGHFGIEERVFLVGSTETVTTAVPDATLIRSQLLELLGSTESVVATVTDASLFGFEVRTLQGSTETVTTGVTDGTLIRTEDHVLLGSTEIVSTNVTDGTFGTEIFFDGSEERVVASVSTARASVRTDGRYTGIPEIVSTTVSTADLSARHVLTGSTVDVDVTATDATLIRTEAYVLLGSTETVTSDGSTARLSLLEEPVFRGSTETVTATTHDGHFGIEERRFLVGSTEIVGSDASTADLTTTEGFLRLSDFDATGRDVNLLALVTASGDTRWYADSNRGGSDDGPTDGELGFGPDETLISRILWNPSNNWVQLNDNDQPSATNLGTFINSDDWRLTIQTLVDGELTSRNDTGRGGNRVRFSFDNGDDQDALNGIVTGTRFIIAIWRPEEIVTLVGSTETVTVGTSDAVLPHAVRFSGLVETVDATIPAARVTTRQTIVLSGVPSDAISEVSTGSLGESFEVLLRASQGLSTATASTATLQRNQTVLLSGTAAESRAIAFAGTYIADDGFCDQTIELPRPTTLGTGFAQWNDIGEPIDTRLTEGDSQYYLQTITLRTFQLQIDIGPSETDSGGRGQDLISAVESSLEAFTFSNGSNDLVLPGPATADRVVNRDTQEPYSYFLLPTSIFVPLVNAWTGASDLADDFTITISDQRCLVNFQGSRVEATADASVATADANNDVTLRGIAVDVEADVTDSTLVVVEELRFRAQPLEVTTATTVADVRFRVLLSGRPETVTVSTELPRPDRHVVGAGYFEWIDRSGNLGTSGEIAEDGYTVTVAGNWTDIPEGREAIVAFVPSIPDENEYPHTTAENAYIDTLPDVLREFLGIEDEEIVLEGDYLTELDIDTGLPVSTSGGLTINTSTSTGTLRVAA